MTYRSIVVHLGTDRRTDARTALAIDLARRFDARLHGVFTAPLMLAPVAFNSPAPIFTEQMIEAHRAAVAKAGEEAARAFLAVAEAAGVSAEAETLEGEPGPLVARLTRYADLAVVGQSEEEGLGALARQLPEQVVLGSGHGVLVVPYAGHFDTVGRRIVLAWNGSREAVRAASEAMPLLSAADHVTVLEMDPEDGEGAGAMDFAHHLARHGVRAEARHTTTTGLAAGEILLSTVAESGADLLVMGAYGHSRLREIALGGVTRSVLAHMTAPVLMAS